VQGLVRMCHAIKYKIFRREKERLRCGVSCAQDLFVRKIFVKNILHLSEVEAAVEVLRQLLRCQSRSVELV
jgi:hypothetical protein